MSIKQKYKYKKYNGYVWFYWDEETKRHHFQKEIPGQGFLELICRDEQLENGDFEYMADHNLTLRKN